MAHDPWVAGMGKAWVRVCSRVPAGYPGRSLVFDAKMGQPATATGPDRPQILWDRNWTVQDWSTSVYGPKKDWFKPVFCHKIWCTKITHRFLHNYYPDHSTIVWVDGDSNSSASLLILKRFH